MIRYFVFWGCSCGLGVFTHLMFRNWGYRKGRDDGFKAGHRKGFELGWKDGDNWWIGVEEAAQQSREELWREELETNRKREK